ncbi:MAG TPA: serine/threonine-protein kinase [Kofleriaceae bacterium]|nr:serine/threonine-protein kinase [Kofleriaceae bacterium]
MACLDASTVATLLSGEVSEADRRRIDGHIDRCAECRRLIAALVRDRGAAQHLADRTLSRTDSLDDRELHVLLGPGDQVARYVIDRFLGAGAMGAVYQAQDPELGRTVALKLTRTAAEARTRRLIREAQAMAKLSHPNIVPIYDAGKSGDLMFIAMKQIEGESLRQRLADRSAKRAERIRWLGDAARGLMAAHAAGIIHRDLKPDNILIDADGSALVGDFGLALVRGDLIESEPPQAHADGVHGGFLTATGTLLGTPAYMAPEVKAGKAADALSDQYSFAVTAAEVLGTRPGEKLEAAHLPRTVKRALRRALAEDPHQRFASMAAFGAALCPPPTIRRAAIAVAILVAMAALLWMVAPAGSTQDPSVACRESAATRIASVWNDDVHKRMAEHLVGNASAKAATLGKAALDRIDGYAKGWLEMRVDACEATHTRGEQSVALLDLRMACLDDRLAELGAVKHSMATLDARELIVADQLTGLLGDLDQCANVALLSRRTPLEASQVAIASALRGRLTAANATIMRGRIARVTSSGTVDFSAAVNEVSAVLAQARRAHLPALAADALRVRSFLLGKGKGPGETDDLLTSLAIGDRLGDPAVRADALIGLLNDASTDAARASEVKLLARLASAAIDQLPEPQRMRRARVDGNLAVNLLHQGKADEAVSKFEQVVAVYDAERGPENLYTMNTRKLLAAAYAKAGRIDDAVAVYDRMIEALRKTFGNEHAFVVVVMLIEANKLGAAGRLDQASAVLQRALVMAQKVHGKNHPQVAKVLDTIGFVELDRNPRAALKPFGRALAIAEAAPDHNELGSALIGLGLTQLERGRAAIAAATLERGLRQTGPAAVSKSLLPAAQFALAQALWKTGGDRKRAQKLAQSAHQQYEVSGPWPDDSAAEVAAWLEAHP